TAIAARPDGTLLGIGTDKALYTREAAGTTQRWVKAPNSADMRALTVLKDGSLVAVRTDEQLYVATGVPSEWQPLAMSGQVIALAGLRDGRVLGVGSDNVLYVRRTLTELWDRLGDTGSVLSIAVMPDDTIVGAGTDNQLYTRRALDGGWEHIADSGAVTSVAALPDGSIAGVGMDQALYTRATLTSAWQQVAGSGPLASIGAAPDGTLYGVRPDGALVRRRTPTGDWSEVAGGGTIKAIAVLPDTAPNAGDWLLQFTSPDPAAYTGDGRPWGDGTEMAGRAAQRRLPWDNGSLVTPMVGGAQAMAAIRDTFEAAIAEADRLAAEGRPRGQRGHVYIADWLFNGLRDLSEANPWGGAPWDPATIVAKDQTALGLVLRMMAAGINVRLLLWMPTDNQRTQMPAHFEEHKSVAAAIQDYNDSLQKAWGLSEPIGVVGLDLRTASPISASLHQKMIVVRVGTVNAGFCGGVDLAFTRRDFGRIPTKVTGIGDWQSGETTMPLPSRGWPKQRPAPEGGYPAFPFSDPGRFPEDLPKNVYGAGNRRWHDQHLKLEGPIVASLESQFNERWVISAWVYPFDRYARVGGDNQVQFTSRTAYSGNVVKPLPALQPVAPVGEASVQVWRTIPLRLFRSTPPFARGEFTVMAGIAKAVARATELITIWDQYFWSVGLARLLAARLAAVPTLRLLVVLPPYGTTLPSDELKLRYDALQWIWRGLDDRARKRVFAADMWAAEQNVGIYVHAKVQTYDDALLVCGSANMNRRSFECDAELDCAVLHRGTVQAHLAQLHQTINGRAWTDFSEGWLGRYWASVTADHARSLVSDPFYAAEVRNPKTPNGVDMPYAGTWRQAFIEPSSIGTNVDTSGWGCPYPDCPGDPKSIGTLDQITWLLERCHRRGDFYWRQANWHTTAVVADPPPGLTPEQAVEPELPDDVREQIPRLTL
ncbi:MAG TPA: tectonin domain-containing protein, partial [Solirubrobacteraceae bacterium]|nr:tectonin domain-containing protein [Solirubrobacteraceae bacterium]